MTITTTAGSTRYQLDRNDVVTAVKRFIRSKAGGSKVSVGWKLAGSQGPMPVAIVRKNQNKT